MIIETVELNNWKGIEHAALSLEPGINILYGPNEIGKSTVLHALKTGILEEARKNSSVLKDLIPWHRQVKAGIKVTLLTGKGERYRIEKTFPKGEARLLFIDGEKEKVVAEGSNVTPFFKDRFGFDDSLAALFDLLWVEQGETVNLFQNSKEQLLSRDLKNRIQEMIKERLISPVAEEFYETVRSQYYDYFTPSGRGYKSASGSKGKLVQELEDDKKKREKQIVEIDADIETYRKKSARLVSYDETIRESSQELGKIDTYLEQLKRKKQSYDTVHRLFLELRPQLEKYEQLLSIEREIASHNKLLPLSYERKRTLAGQRSREIDEKLAMFHDRKNQLSDVEKDLRSTPAIDEKSVEKAMELESSLREIDITLRQSEINIKIEPEKPFTFQIQTDDQEKESRVIEEEYHFRASRSASLISPEEYTIEITGPLSEEQFTKVKRKRSSVQSEYEQILEKYGVTEARELQRGLDRFKELKQKKAALESSLQTIDGDQLARQKKELENFLAFYEQSVKEQPANGPAPPPQPQSPPQFNTLDEADRYIARLEDALSANEKRKQTLLGEKSVSRFKEEVETLQRQHDNKREQLTLLEPLDVDEITDSLLSKEEQKREKMREKISRLKEERARLSGELANQEDLPAKKSRLEHSLMETQKKLRKEYIAISSLQTLIDVIEEEKRSIEQNVVAPVQSRISKAFETMTAGNYPAVTLDNDFGIFQVEARAFDKKPVAVSPDILSTGTQEQLSFLFRFVLAEQLSQSETHIMALDDSFVNSDRERMKQIISMMQSAEDRIQFIVFTCNEEDYTRFGEIGRYIDLRDHIK